MMTAAGSPTHEQYERAIDGYMEHAYRAANQWEPPLPDDEAFVEALYRGVNADPTTYDLNTNGFLTSVIYEDFWRTVRQAYTPNLPNVFNDPDDPFTPLRAYSIATLAAQRRGVGDSAAYRDLNVTFDGKAYDVLYEAEAFAKQAANMFVRYVERANAGASQHGVAPMISLSGPLARRWAAEQELCRHGGQPFFILVGHVEPRREYEEFSAAIGILWYGNELVTAVARSDYEDRWIPLNQPEWPPAGTPLSELFESEPYALLGEFTKPPFGHDQGLAPIDEDDVPPALANFIAAVNGKDHEGYPKSIRDFDDYVAIIPPFYGAYIDPCDLVGALVLETHNRSPIVSSLYTFTRAHRSIDAPHSLVALAAQSYSSVGQTPLFQVPAPLEVTRQIAAHQWRRACHPPDRSPWERIVDIALASGVDPGELMRDPETGLLVGTSVYPTQSALCNDIGIALSREPFALSHQ